ncbi:hypothetical protein PoB_004175100 [Plakobranchus ocellatus]|uniref:Uncharacterized protein n=1 Tax=Plakobranchus ocellatus TaxID=259542 RepID=A0AAV4B458_9GAST|nr:hypothetical protein PoB_004175100 [Plakobranchus ocellatus]
MTVLLHASIDTHTHIHHSFAGPLASLTRRGLNPSTRHTDSSRRSDTVSSDRIKNSRRGGEGIKNSRRGGEGPSPNGDTWGNPFPEVDEFLQFVSENVASPGPKIIQNQHRRVRNFCRGLRNLWNLLPPLDPALLLFPLFTKKQV